MTEEAVIYQAIPKSSSEIDIADMVKADIEARANLGLAKYGERLKPFNTRDPLTDLYQELLDAVMYLKQVFVERDIDINLPEPKGISCPVCFAEFDMQSVTFASLSFRGENALKYDVSGNIHSEFPFRCESCGNTAKIKPVPSTEYFVNA